MRLTAVNIHPVKSTAIRPLAAAEVLPAGLVDDRCWMVVDHRGGLVSAREVPALFHVTADTPVTDPALGSDLRLRAPARPDLLLDHPAGTPVPVRLFGTDLEAVPAGDEADSWLQRALGRPDLRLVWCDDPTRRRLNPTYARNGEHTAFADSFPVTLASETSLRQLDDWMVETALDHGEEPGEPLPIQRFRANLVVDGAEPFAEDRWSTVRVGRVRFRVAKPAGRCVMTTVDPETLRSGREPIRTLARYRRAGTRTLFAVHLVPETSGTVYVGDPVSAC